MSEDFDKYLAIANHDIQMARDMGELKSYVASLLYDYDRNVEQLLLDKCKAELEVVRLNNIINEIEKDLEDRYYGRGKYNLSTDIVGIPTFLNRIKEIKGGEILL